MKENEEEIETTEFIRKLIHDGSRTKDKQDADLRIVIKIYKNAFAIREEGLDDISALFYSLGNKNNREMFNKIKQGILPLEQLQLKNNINITKDTNICVIVEDYSRESKFTVDPKEKSTEIIIKLLNGITLTKQVNTYHTIKDIKEVIRNDTLLQPNEYSFIIGYPPKEIEDKEEDKTIQELKLENASLIQKYIKKNA